MYWLLGKKYKLINSNNSFNYNIGYVKSETMDYN